MFKATLAKPYQVDGVKWMLTREFHEQFPGGFLCDEMGLGKTVQTIATICYNKVPKTLVIVPSSIVTQWVDEIHTHSSLDVSILTKSNTKKNDGIFITTYGMLSKKGTLYNTLKGTDWDRIILDEAHELRNPKSKRFGVLLEIPAKIRWILTGTPVFNTKLDYRTLLRFLTNDKPFINENNSHILRRTKSDLVKFDKSLEIPRCTFECIELERYPEEEQGYTQVFNQFAQRIQHANSQTLAMVVLEGFLRMRQYSSNPEVYHFSIPEIGPYLPDRCRKTDYLVESICTHRDEKTLVFCQFLREMDIIKDMLVQNNVKVFRLDGSTTEDRDTEIRDFKSHTGGAVFLIQIKAGGQGLNLQEASRVYITIPAWNPATELQAISRSHRKGQTRPVHIKKLVYVSDSDTPSIDESIVELQDHKSIVCADVLNDPRLSNQLPKLRKKFNMVKVFRKFFLTNT